MEYNLESADNGNKDLLIKYKLNSIFNYALNLSAEEQTKINKFINEHIKEQINDYKLIKCDNKIIGCLLVIPHLDGVILDEIFIEAEYRNKKIGSNIIRQILLDNDIVYLWVYKNNERAFKLYRKFGFNIDKETDTRYFMKYSKIMKAREFCEKVKELSKEFDLPFFIVTDGASATSNNGCKAVKVARENHIKWEKENNFDPNEDWEKGIK